MVESNGMNSPKKNSERLPICFASPLLKRAVGVPESAKERSPCGSGMRRFLNELRWQREQLMAVALEGLSASALKASVVLVGLLESPNDRVRLKAAETIVRFARR